LSIASWLVAWSVGTVYAEIVSEETVGEQFFYDAGWIRKQSRRVAEVGWQSGEVKEEEVAIENLRRYLS
jgi:hypothetical protein